MKFVVFAGSALAWGTMAILSIQAPALAQEGLAPAPNAGLLAKERCAGLNKSQSICLGEVASKDQPGKVSYYLFTRHFLGKTAPGFIPMRLVKSGGPEPLGIDIQNFEGRMVSLDQRNYGVEKTYQLQLRTPVAPGAKTMGILRIDGKQAGPGAIEFRASSPQSEVTSVIPVALSGTLETVMAIGGETTGLRLRLISVYGDNVSVEIKGGSEETQQQLRNAQKSGKNVSVLGAYQRVKGVEIPVRDVFVAAVVRELE